MNRKINKSVKNKPTVRVNVQTTGTEFAARKLSVKREREIEVRISMDDS